MPRLEVDMVQTGRFAFVLQVNNARGSPATRARAHDKEMKAVVAVFPQDRVAEAADAEA